MNLKLRIQPNHTWSLFSDRSRYMTEDARYWRGAAFCALAIAIVAIGSLCYRVIKDEQKANRASLDSGPLKSNYTARAGDR